MAIRAEGNEILFAVVAQMAPRLDVVENAAAFLKLQDWIEYFGTKPLSSVPLIVP
jgi:hypothetical protein